MYLKQNFASKAPGNRDQCKRPWYKDIFATFFSYDLNHGFLAEFGKTYIIFIEIRHVTCSLFFINIEPQACVWNMGQRLFKRQNWNASVPTPDKFCLVPNYRTARAKCQPLINCAWSLTTVQPVLRALSSQNVHLLTCPVDKIFKM